MIISYKFRFPVLLFFVVLFFDQLSKWWFRSHSYNIIDGFFWLSPSTNTGSAFGLFQWVPNFVFILLSIIVIVACLYIFYFQILNPESRILISLFLSGVSGNLIDRLFFGRVTDFIAFSFWPSFNIADSMMMMSVLLFLFYSFLEK